MKTKLITSLLVAIIAMSGLTVTASATEQGDQTVACYEPVAQTQWQYETFKTQHEVDKFTRTKTKTRAQEWFIVWYDVGTWSEWSDWSTPERWPGNTHLAWVDEVPAENWQYHGSGEDIVDTTPNDSKRDRVKWERQWTIYPTGETQQISTGFVTSEWVDGTNPPDDQHPWVKIGDRNRDGDQIPCEEQPDPTRRSESTDELNCEAFTVTTTTLNWLTPMVLDDNFQWVPGEEVRDGDPVIVTRDATKEELQTCPDIWTPGTPQYHYTQACLPEGGINVNLFIANDDERPDYTFPPGYPFYQDFVLYMFQGTPHLLAPGVSELIEFTVPEDAQFNDTLTIDGQEEPIILELNTDCIQPVVTSPPAPTPPSPPVEEPKLPVTGALTFPMIVAGLGLMGSGFGLKRLGRK